jgi:DNA-3-methyladenine glycosylase II
MKPRYDFDLAIRELSTTDPTLGSLIKDLGAFDLKIHRTGDLYASLIRSIIYQQLHGKAAAKIHARVLALVGNPPAPLAVTATADEALRGAGLSGAKLAAIRDLTAQSAAGIVPTLAQARRLSDDELTERLTSIRGIGPWTVHMLLIFRLGRPDVVPTGDFAIRLAFSQIFHDSSAVKPTQLLAYAERWRPWRSVASWYLWRSLDPSGGI